MFEGDYLDPVACDQEQTLKEASSRESVQRRVKNVNGIHKNVLSSYSLHIASSYVVL